MDTKYLSRDFAIVRCCFNLGRQYEKLHLPLELLVAVSDLMKTKLPQETRLGNDPAELMNVLSAPRQKRWNIRLDPEELHAVLPDSCPPTPAKTDKLDFELAAFESRLMAGQLAQYLHQYVAIHRGRVFDSDDDEFRLAARVAPAARREGPIAVCHVTTLEPQEEDDPLEADLGQFESPLCEGFADEV